MHSSARICEIEKVMKDAYIKIAFKYEGDTCNYCAPGVLWGGLQGPGLEGPQARVQGGGGGEEEGGWEAGQETGRT